LYFVLICTLPRCCPGRDQGRIPPRRLHKSKSPPPPPPAWDHPRSIDHRFRLSIEYLIVPTHPPPYRNCFVIRTPFQVDNTATVCSCFCFQLADLFLCRHCRRRRRHCTRRIVHRCNSALQRLVPFAPPIARVLLRQRPWSPP